MHHFHIIIRPKQLQCKRRKGGTVGHTACFLPGGHLPSLHSSHLPSSLGPALSADILLPTASHYVPYGERPGKKRNGNTQTSLLFAVKSAFGALFCVTKLNISIEMQLTCNEILASGAQRDLIHVSIAKQAPQKHPSPHRAVR